MLALHQWLAEKQKQQSLRAIFQDCWTLTYGQSCRTNMTEIDARNYDRCCVVPIYVLSVFRRERCRTH